MFPPDAQSMMDLMRRYADQARVLARRGVHIVVLPEMTVIDPGLKVSQLSNQLLSSQADEIFLEAARAANIRILLGVEHVRGIRALMRSGMVTCR